MKLCLTDMSAMQFWRYWDNANFDLPIFGHTVGCGPVLRCALASSYFSPEKKAIEFDAGAALLAACNLSQYGFSDGQPLHLLVNRRKKDLVMPNAVMHSISLELPKGALLDVAHALTVVSPEMLAVLAFGSKDFVERLLIAYELCGCYAMRPDLPRGISQRHPLCTPESVVELARGMHGVRGCSLALKEMGYVRAGSGSPRETMLTLLMCLPMSKGGFGLPFPELNLNIGMGYDGKLFWDRGNAFDLVWKERRLVVEYDGKADHEASASRERDAARRAALVAEGYTVVVVTKAQLSTDRGGYALAKLIAKKLGKRLRFRNDDFGVKHRELRSQLGF